MTDPIAGARTPPGRAPEGPRCSTGLTPEQAQAVRHGPGPLLLIAGPGAGKTKTLIHRIARLLQDGCRTAVGDSRGHLLGAGCGRAAAAARRSSRRAGRARSYRGDVSLDLLTASCREHAGASAAPSTSRSTTSPTCAAYRLGALRPAARADTTSARRLRAARERPRCTPRSRWRRTGCGHPDCYERHARDIGHPADRRGVARRPGSSCTLKRDRLRRPAGPSAVRLLAEHPDRLAFYRTAGDGSWSTSSRTPTRPRASWSPCWPGRTATSAA